MTLSLAARRELAGATALIVEDHDDSRELLCAALESRGMDVHAAASVGAAVGLLSVEQVDIIISDIGLPDEDGLAFIRRVRGSETGATASTPAIALTAFAGPEDRTQALVAGFNVYLTKPFDFGLLISSVKHLVWPQ